jgi:hypothetical protein
MGERYESASASGRLDIGLLAPVGASLPSRVAAGAPAPEDPAPLASVVCGRPPERLLAYCDCRVGVVGE